MPSIVDFFLYRASTTTSNSFCAATLVLGDANVLDFFGATNQAGS